MPQSLVRRALLPVVPAVDRLAFQVVHAYDMARAYVLACTTPVTGAFNIATEPVLDPPTLAAVLGARHVPVPGGAAARRSSRLTWRLHLQPTDPGWVDIGRLTPLLDTTRARTELGWTPRYDAGRGAARDRRGDGAPAAAATRRSCGPRAGRPGRVLEVVRALVPGAQGTG